MNRQKAPVKIVKLHRATYNNAAHLRSERSKGKGAHKPKAQTARVYPGFLSMEHT